MSRIGKKPIAVPGDVTVTIEGDTVKIKGPKGEDHLRLHPDVHVTHGEGMLKVSVDHSEEKQNRALWGLYRALLANLVKGVTAGFEKKLEMVGVGYKAAVQGKKLVLEVGFSHPVEVPLPEGITAAVDKNIITISGINRALVGQVTATIRAIRKPEPYKGKGIKYVGEVIRRKAGKAAKAAGTK